MKAYLIILISLVTIISLVVILLPEGKMKKVTCISLSFIITLTLLTPLKNYYSDIVLETPQIEYDILNEYNYKNNLYSFAIKKILEQENVKVIEVKITFKEDFEVVKKIGIKLNKSGINQEDEHISIIVKTKNILIDRFNLKEEDIYFYE